MHPSMETRHRLPGSPKQNIEVGMAEYDSYITNGMMLQLRRLDEGENIEEDHI